MTGQLRSHAKRIAITGGLEASWLLNSAGLLRRARGRGAIFTLHHVRPHQRQVFDPNAHLEITPQFLGIALETLKADGYRFVPLSAVPQLLMEAEAGAPFAAFTLDDGYRNNLEHALPVFAKYEAPFTVFVAKGLAEGSHGVWWETLAMLLRKGRKLAFDFGHGSETLRLDTPVLRKAAFEQFARYIHRVDEAEAVAALDALAWDHDVDPVAIIRDLAMGPDALKRLVKHPLADLGAHTISHRALARLPEADARDEMSASADYVESLTGTRPTSFAYPYGTSEAATRREGAIARDLGFELAVTTQPGVLTPASSADIHYLPRISLNGLYQKPRYVSALASGIPIKMMRR